MLQHCTLYHQLVHLLFFLSFFILPCISPKVYCSLPRTSQPLQGPRIARVHLQAKRTDITGPPLASHEPRKPGCQSSFQSIGSDTTTSLARSISKPRHSPLYITVNTTTRLAHFTARFLKTTIFCASPSLLYIFSMVQRGNPLQQRDFFPSNRETSWHSVDRTFIDPTQDGRFATSQLSLIHPRALVGT